MLKLGSILLYLYALCHHEILTEDYLLENYYQEVYRDKMV